MVYVESKNDNFDAAIPCADMYNELKELIPWRQLLGIGPEHYKSATPNTSTLTFPNKFEAQIETVQRWAAPLYQPMFLAAGHKYLFLFDYKIYDEDGQPEWYVSISSPVASARSSICNCFENKLTWTHVANILTGTGWTDSPGFLCWQGTTHHTIFNIRYLMCFDLTEMYGAGNEPTSEADFRKDYPNLYYYQNITNSSKPNY